MRVAATDRDTTLGTTGRAVRLLAAAVVLVLATAGTVWGQDSAFPFGPFRMYSTRSGTDVPVNSTRIDAITAAGVRGPIADADTGLRRAEIEGQLPRLIADPSLLELIAQSYVRRNPDRPPLIRIEIVVRRYELRAGAATGQYSDTVLAAWDADDTTPEPVP
ncbi:MAG: hypothetical protein H0V67_06355 [Geodermatophilaceae bacterium]|nr:hypothetical protein [Geodermatophilaceae bacterium]